MADWYSYFVNPLTTIRFYQIGYTFTFLFGFLGCLFITLAITDIFYLLMCVFDYLEFGFSVPFYGRVEYNGLCRFRSFIMYTSQFASAWILVAVSVDRWIRTRFPFKSNSLCTPKKALLVVAGLLILDVGLHSHMLTPMFGMLIPRFANAACGPVITDANYLRFYYVVWIPIEICIACAIPAFLMLIILIDVFVQVRLRRRAIHQLNQGNNHQGNVQKQMFILTLASIGIFFCTNLPVGISTAVLARGNAVLEAGSHTTIVTALGWLQSWNYAMHFYIYCSSSTLFRHEFRKRMSCFFPRTATIIHNTIGPTYIKAYTQNNLPQVQ